MSKQRGDPNGYLPAFSLMMLKPEVVPFFAENFGVYGVQGVRRLCQTKCTCW